MIKRRVLALGIAFTIALSGYSAAEQKDDIARDAITTDSVDIEMNDTQRNSINMLNYLTVLTQKINSSQNSRLYLEEAYSSIVNNTYPNAVDNRTLGELNTLLDTLEGYRMVAVKRERLEYVYEQNKAQALRAAVPNPIGLLSAVSSFNLIDLVASVSYMAIDSVTSYQSASAKVDLKYLQDGWALDDKDAEFLHNQRKDTFTYMVKTVNEKNLPGELALTEKAVEDFVSWKNNSNVVGRIRFLESNKKTYKAYGGYWLLLAASYHENREHEKCLDSIKEYNNLNISIFRKDYDYAQVLPLVIASAEEICNDSDFEIIASKYADDIVNNTGVEQWDLRYFAAQSYIKLYGLTKNKEYIKKAYDIALDNVNSMVSEQRTLNNQFMEEVVEAKAEPGSTKEQKEDIKNYNKLLKAERKTELPPVYEPLVLNCDLLFSLADMLNISINERNEIDSILHENGNSLFLVEPIDSIYYISKKTIDNVDENIVFEGNELTIPARYISADGEITVTVTDDDTTEDFTDWKITQVKRKTKGDISTFLATYTSNAAKKYKFEDGTKIKIIITCKKGMNTQAITAEFESKLKENWKIIPDQIVFQRIE